MAMSSRSARVSEMGKTGEKNSLLYGDNLSNNPYSSQITSWILICLDFFLFLSYNLETSMSIWNYSCFRSKTDDDDDDDTMMTSWWRRQCWIWLWWWLSNRLRQLRKENVITSRNFPASFLHLRNFQELPPSVLRTYPWKVYIWLRDFNWKTFILVFQP